MPQGRKLALAASLLAAGIAWALFFRRSPEIVDPPSYDAPVGAVARKDESAAPRTPHSDDDREPIRVFRLSGLLEQEPDEASPEGIGSHRNRPSAVRSPFESAAFGPGSRDTTEDQSDNHEATENADDENPDDGEESSLATDGWRRRPPGNDRLARIDASSPDAKRPASAPPQDRKYRKYQLQDGDTLSQLADRFLGSGKRFMEIYEVNRTVLTSPDLLPIGATIRIPWEERSERRDEPNANDLAPVIRSAGKRPASSTGPRTYRVREGDTLAQIAQQFYGDERRWPELVEANSDQLGDEKPLREDMTLIVP